MADDVTVQEIPDSGTKTDDSESSQGSIRDKIERAYDELEKKAGEEAEEAAEVKGDGNAEKNKLPKPDQDAKTSTEQTEKDAKEEASDSDDKNADSKEDKPKVKAPVSWSRKDRAVFEKLDPEAQEIVSRRELERDKALQRATTDRANLEKAVKPLIELSEKVKDISRVAKVKPHEFIDTLVQADQEARKDPVGFIERFAEANGVDLKILAEGDKDSAWDSEMHQAAQTIRQLQAQVEALSQQQQSITQQATQAQQQAQFAPGQAAVLQFFQGEKLQDLEADPHLLDRVIVEAEIIRRNDPGASPHEVLEEAYENAVYASPTLRQAYQQRKAHAQQEARRQELEAARKRQGLRSSAPGARAAKQYGSTRARIEAIYDDLASR